MLTFAGNLLCVDLRQTVYTACVTALDEKIRLLQNTLRELSEGAQNDTKSSAGDKHETARAMMQLEQEKTGRQLNDAEQQKLLLEKMAASVTSGRVAPGSLVKTNRGYLFLAVALGKVQCDGIPVMAISPQSPLGAKLIGQSSGATVSINGAEYVIESLL